MEEGKPVEQGEKSGVDKNTEKDIAQKEDTEDEQAEKTNNEKENEEIDIYLFSNGQVYSPPRKYHLRIDELQQWEATLDYLARKQYGSLHSDVELYELDGRKVEDPKSVRDCAVYVAVVPPDPFIYAGYDKYLVKASKSYEKRLSKRANGAPGETSSPDNLQEDGTNLSKLSQDFTPAPGPVKDNELRPVYPSIRNNNEVRKSSLKNSNQKLDDKTKPISNQVSQSSHVTRILNLRSSDSVAKKTSINRKDTPRSRSNLNTTSGVLGKNSSINQSIDKGKSPYMPELYVCDHSAHRVNESLPTFASKSNKINTNKEGSKVSMPSIRQTINPINKNTKKLGDTFTITKKTLVDELYKEHNKQPKSSTLKPNNTLRKDLPNQVSENQISGRNKSLLLKTDNKLPSPGKIRIFQPTDKPSIEHKKRGPPISQITMITNTRASMVDISNQNSKEHTAINKATKHENFQAGNHASATPENKMTVIEEIPKLIDKVKGPDTTETKNNEPSQITMITNTRASMVDISNQNSKEYTAINKATKHENFQIKNRVSATSENKITVIEAIPKLKDKVKGPETTDNKKIELKSNLINKRTTKYDKIVEELNNGYNIPDVDETSKFTYKDQVDKDIIFLSDTSTNTSEDQSIKTTETESLTNKIKIAKVEPVSVLQYIDTALEKENKINNKRDIAQANDTKLNENDADASKTESLVYDLKVPMLYIVPEKAIKDILNREENGRAILSNKELLSGDSHDITIKAVDEVATKTHSFTFVIKKDDIHNQVKVTDIKVNPKDNQEIVKAPITSIVQDKDIVHVNVYRSSLSESSPMKDNKAGTQLNGKHYNEKANKYKTETSKKDGKEADVKTTFINHKSEEKSAAVVHEPVSKDLINDVMEPTTSQFVEFVQSGDIVNLKLSIQIKNSEGILKSTQGINMEKSNSDNHLENDDTNQTANELTRSKSLQSVEDDAPHLCCRKDRVVVYQCACCTQTGAENTNYNLTANPIFPGQGFYVLLPVAMPVQDSITAPCQTCDKQVQHTESFIKTSLNIANKETLISVPGDGDKPAGIKLSSMSQNIKVNEKFLYDSPTKRQVAIQGQDVNQSRLIMMRTDPSQTSARYNMETKQQQTITFTQDQFTQTDWCDVLLEARPEADGHFTFYLPPLHLLQQYTLR